MKRPRTRRVRKGGARLTERPRGGVASLGRSDTARYFRASTAAEITVIRDECRQASVVVASLPHRLRHLSAMVLQCLRHGVWAGDRGARQQCRPPRAIPEHLRPRRDPLCAARPRCNHQVESAPPRCVVGDCGWAGRAGEPLLGGYGVHRRDNHVRKVPGSKSTNCGSIVWPQQLRTDQAFRWPAVTQRSPWVRFTTRPISTSPNGVSVLHWGSAKVFRTLLRDFRRPCPCCTHRLHPPIEPPLGPTHQFRRSKKLLPFS